jgi:exonuclease III
MLPAVPPQAINHTRNAPAHQQNARPPATREANIRANQRPPRLGENINPPRPNKPKLRANINIATLNMNGYAAPSNNMSHLEKWTMINQTINKHRITILALQETHLDQERVDTLLTLYGKKMDIVFSMDPNAPRATAGVAFVINKTLIEPKKLTTYELQAGRALALNIDWLETENTTLINIYAPNDRTRHEQFWSNLETERRAKGITRPNFLLGDFNLTEDAIDRMPAHLDDPRATEALRDLRQNWDLQDAWRVAFPEDRVFTYRSHANQIKSRLDRIYIARRTLDLTYDWIITPSAVPMDHWMATVKFAPKNTPHIGNRRWTLPLMLLNNKAFINEIIKRGMELQDKIEKLQDEDIPRRRSNPQRLWEDFKEEIKEAAKDHTDKTHYKLASRIKAIEKDMNELAQHPNADTDIHIRTRENHLAHERVHLERKQAKGWKGTLSANIALHGEKMGGTWSAMSKVRKPRDYIRCLKIPNSDPPKYERNTKRMANLAKEYHDSLQRIELNRLDDYEERINLILDEIPRNQKLPEPERSNLNRPITELQTEQALRGTKNRTATGMDGCPYELWKALKTHYDSATRSNKPGFDIIKMLTDLYNDIQTHGVECGTSFSLGWMCPIYKKKDPTDISNY